MSASIRLDGVSKSYGGVAVLDHVDVTVDAGSFTCLLGPSGSGKSTLLGCVSGLVAPDTGTVEIDSRDMSEVPPHRRPVTMMLQQPQLFPFLSVADNVAFGLRTRKIGKVERRATALEMLDLVGLDVDPDRGVDGLSGGEAQRVSLARALAVRPHALLLDEPLASLDPPVRRTLQDLLGEIHRRSGTTMVLVTHDRDEALSLADHMVVLDAGAACGSGSPADLFERPPTLAAARLLGVENVFDATDFGFESGWVSIRPERVVVDVDDHGGGVVERLRYLGARTEATVVDAERTVVASLPTGACPQIGTRVRCALPPEALVHLDG